MRKAILILFCVAALSFAGWRAALMFGENLDETQVPPPPPPVHELPKEIPPPTLAERYAKALAEVDLAALEKNERPAFTLRVLTVSHGSSAEEKGIKVGDRISKLNGQPVVGVAAFSKAFARQSTNTVTFLSDTAGAKDYTFSGRMGVVFIEDSSLDLAYIRSAKRGPDWDNPMVVAARLAVDDPEVALRALADAKAADYSGWLDPAVSIVSNFVLSKHDEALKHLPLIKSIPAESAHEVLSSLYRSAVLAGRLDVAADLEKECGDTHLRPREWDMDTFFARYRALTDSERALIGVHGNLKREVARDYSRNLASFDANGKTVLDYLKRHTPQEYSVNTGPHSDSFFRFGPFAQNAGLKMTFNFDASQRGGDFCIGITDSYSQSSDPLAEIFCSRTGAAEILCEGYPRIYLSKYLLHVNGDNKAEIYVNGPWLEIWMNSQNVFRGIAALRERELYFRVVATDVVGKFKDIEYGELDSDGWKPAGAPPAVKAAPKSLTIPKRPASGDVKWFYDAYVTGYLDHGKLNPAWDADAVEALALAARFFGRDASADPTAILAASRRAVEQGCDDPLLLRVHGDMLCFVEKARSPEGVRSFRRAADGISGTKYNDLLKFQILMQCAEFEAASDLDPLIERADARLAKAIDLIPAALEDAGVPGWFVREIFVKELQLRKHGADRVAQLEPILKAVHRVPRADSLALTMKGGTYITYAWDARGNGWAKDVTPEGWRLFHERMSVAKEALTKAWKLDAANSTAMELLIKLAMAGDGDLDMATCFLNAVRADPGNIAAYHAFLYALTPRWGGDVAALHQFGVECFDSVKNDATANVAIARILLDAHIELANDDSLIAAPDPAARARAAQAYWEREEVWKEVDQVFKLILERAPTNLAKSEYAHYAAKCKQWSVANKLFDELGPNLAAAPFGGPMLAWQYKRNAKGAALKEGEKE